MIRQFRYIPVALLLAACTEYPVIQSVDVNDDVNVDSDGVIVIKAGPGMFTEAIDMASNICRKSGRLAEYVPNANEDLSVVSFNCVEPQSGTEVVE